MAEDLVQAALAKAYPHFVRIENSGGSFESYVRRVLLNTYLTWWGRKWRSEVPSAELPDDGGQSPEDDRVLLRQDLLSALAELSPRQRAVVVLRYFEDLTELETAGRLGCSLGTVKSHNSRALRILRRSARLNNDHVQEDAK